MNNVAFYLMKGARELEIKFFKVFCVALLKAMLLRLSNFAGSTVRIPVLDTDPVHWNEHGCGTMLQGFEKEINNVLPFLGFNSLNPNLEI